MLEWEEGYPVYGRKEAAMPRTRTGSDTSGTGGGLLFYIVITLIMATCGYLMVTLNVVDLLDVLP